MRVPWLLTVLLAPALGVIAQPLLGTFVAEGEKGPITLEIQRVDGARLSGTLSGNGAQYRVEAEQDGSESFFGIATSPQHRLEVEGVIEGEQLVLLLVQIGSDGQPNYAASQEVLFVRQGAAPVRTSSASTAVPVAPASQVPQVPSPDATVVLPTAPSGQSAAVPAIAGDAALDDGTPLGREWSQDLAGRKLIRMSSYSSSDAGGYGGYSSRDELTLCSSGEYLYRSSSSMSVDTGGSAGSSGGGADEAGRWRIVTQAEVAGLELRAQGGSVTRVRLDYVNEMVHVDGDKVYRTAAELCP